MPLARYWLRLLVCALMVSMNFQAPARAEIAAHIAAAPTAAAAQTSSVSPAPVSGSSADPNPICPVGVAEILPFDSHEAVKTPNREYAAFLWSPLGPGVASGSIWVNASGLAYHVAFTTRKILSQTYSGEVDAIVFRLPEAGHLEDAFVDRLEGGEVPDATGCRPINAWVPGLVPDLRPDLSAKFTKAERAQAASSSIEAEPIVNVQAECKASPLPPTTLRVVNPRTPPGLHESGVVNVLVSLAADSSIITASVVSRTPSTLNDSALGAAKAALYRTEISGCRPIAAAYIFSVAFSAR